MAPVLSQGLRDVRLMRKLSLRRQCRPVRSQRNHIRGALLVWVRTKQGGNQTDQAIYQAKFGQLSNYRIDQLETPSLRFA